MVVVLLRFRPGKTQKVPSRRSSIGLRTPVLLTSRLENYLGQGRAVSRKFPRPQLPRGFRPPEGVSDRIETAQDPSVPNLLAETLAKTLAETLTQILANTHAEPHSQFACAYRRGNPICVLSGESSANSESHASRGVDSCRVKRSLHSIQVWVCLLSGGPCLQRRRQQLRCGQVERVIGAPRKQEIMTECRERSTELSDVSRVR